jgi:hypothetical protein
MVTSAAALCAALAIGVAGCGTREGDDAGGSALAVSATGKFAWMPQGDQVEWPAYVEEVFDDEGTWLVAWGRRRDTRDPPPPVDFAASRIVVVAQHARHGGFGGARFLRAVREPGQTVVEYEGLEPVRGTVHAQVYKGYLGFWAALPRDAGDPVFRRSVRR